MKQYIQYYTDITGEMDEALGSDGMRPLDGRLSLRTILNEIIPQGNFKRYKNFEIRKGNLKHYTAIYRNFNK